MADIKLRESRPVGRVNVIVDGKMVYSDSEYRGAATWVQRTYNLTDAQTLALYRPYKDDYDSMD
jgi:hypothetical protein